MVLIMCIPFSAMSRPISMNASTNSNLDSDYSKVQSSWSLSCALKEAKCFQLGVEYTLMKAHKYLIRNIETLFPCIAIY